MKSALLQVRDLDVSFRIKDRLVPAIRCANFDMAEGEAVGMLGESGCGKTTLALAVMQMLPLSGCVVRGSVRFRDRELLGLPDNQFQMLRGAELTMIFQEPDLSLNPVIRVGTQVADVIRAHRRCDRQQARSEAEWALAQVGLSDNNGVYSRYPHELSGGQKQRVAIAQAIACRPALVIADEPTSNLDPTVQDQVLTLFKQLKERLGVAFLLITHNPALLLGFAERVLVMYAGSIVEQDVPERMYVDPLHPYTTGLINSSPRSYAHEVRGQPMKTIPGGPPDVADVFPGCRFEPRCPERMPICSTRDPDTVCIEPGRSVCCFKWSSNECATVTHREACQ